jgi:hypothetical protein
MNRHFALVSLGLALPLTAWAQTMIEGALITGKSAAAAAKVGSATGNSISRSLGSVNKSLSEVNRPAPVATRGVVPPARPALSSPLVRPGTRGAVPLPAADIERAEEKASLPDANALKVGMSRDELIATAGKPSQIISLPDGGKLVERYKYLANEQELRIILEDGKVVEINPPVAN